MCFGIQESCLGAKDVPEKTIRECTPEWPTTWTGLWITRETNASVEQKVPDPPFFSLPQLHHLHFNIPHLKLL
jgi:hypothetical protein